MNDQQTFKITIAYKTDIVNCFLIVSILLIGVSTYHNGLLLANTFIQTLYCFVDSVFDCIFIVERYVCFRP